ncbi:MAG: paraquat-inducible membrane protein A [Methylophaga sp.]|nr:MAG: paraquat-inducible membrane protein A [Methylophaga sp.]
MIQLNAQQLRWLLVFSSALLLIGFITPMLTISKFIIVKHSLSIITGVWELLIEGQLFLFIIIALFSIVMPLAKIILLFNLLRSTQKPNHHKKLLHLMHDYGRWAMLDVMVVAILIVSVKLGAIASIQVHAGLYIFGTAVLLIMFITQQVVSLSETTLPSTPNL